MTAPLRRRGRRPGSTDTKAEILTAARNEFAAFGFDGATIRGIARAAAVDPALVHHYFGNKQKIFVAALELPLDPSEMVPKLMAPGVAGLGDRLIRFLLSVLDTPDGEARVLAVLRSAVTNANFAALMRGYLLESVIVPNLTKLGVSEPARRAALLFSQVGGVILARYVLQAEPLASASVDNVARWVAPTLQRYLTADLD